MIRFEISSTSREFIDAAGDHYCAELQVEFSPENEEMNIYDLDNKQELAFSDLCETDKKNILKQINEHLLTYTMEN